MSDERSVSKEVGIRVGEKAMGGLFTIMGVFVALYLFVTWWKKAPKTGFVSEPEPIPAGSSGGTIPMQPPIIPPVIMPPEIKPDPVIRLSDINLLSGACATLHYNILQELQMITPGKMYWGLMPKYVEPVGSRYINSAKRIIIYYKNSLKGAPGVFGCDMHWSDVVAYLDYLANNPRAGLDEAVRLSARMVWVKLRNKTYV